MNYHCINNLKELEHFTNYLISPGIQKYNKFSPKLRIGVLASGEGTNFQVLIDLSKKNKFDIEIITLICNKKNAGCIKRAQEFNIPYKIINESNFSNKNDFEDEIISNLKSNNVELVVMAGWMKIVSEKFVNSFKNKIINIHPSLLPSYKGMSPVKDALAKKALITGCTVHFVEKEVDSGDLIIQGAVKIESKDNLESLTKKIHSLEHKILPQAISKAGQRIRESFMDKN